MATKHWPVQLDLGESRLNTVWRVIREGRALTQAEIAERTGFGAPQIGPVLFVLVQMRAAVMVEHGTTRWYLPARLARWATSR